MARGGAQPRWPTVAARTVTARARLLIVDDEPTARTALGDLVRRQGYRPVVAASGAEALAILAGERVAVVLLDLTRPGGIGLAVLEQLAARGLTRTVPVVAVCALSDRETRVAASDRGATAFFDAPLDPCAVEVRLRRLVQARDRGDRAADAPAPIADETRRADRARAASASPRRVIQPAEVEGLLRDAETRMSLTQHQATEHAQRLEHLITNLPLVLWEATAREGAFDTRWVSENAERVLGVAADQLLGPEAWLSHVQPEDRLNLRHRDRAAAADGQWLEQYRWLRPGGTVAHLQTGVTAKAGPDGSTALLGFALDVSEAKQLEVALLQSGKMDALGQLTGGIAHDFNNLLAVILSFAGFVRADLPEGDARRDDVDEVLRAATKGVDLIRQLLIFSRRQPQEKRPMDVNANVVGLTKMLRRSVGEHIALMVTPSARPAIVSMDPGQLDQVLMNLAANARDAMVGGGQLHVTVSHPVESVEAFAPGRYVRIVVADTGCGMDEDTLARIFEPFFTTKAVGKGTGLGLATTYAIVRDAGGTIRADSEPGRGTRLTIELPVCDLPVEVIDPAVVSPNLQATGEHVLVVEDDAALRKAAVRILEAAGYRVSQAQDGEEAIEWLDAPGHGVDLIFTDVVMPGRGGYAVAAHAKAGALQVSVLMTSGYLDGRADAEPGAGSDQLPLLWKPYTPTSLLRAARDVLRAARAVAAPEVPRAARVRATAPAPAALVAPGRLVLVVDDDVMIRSMLRAVLVRQGGYQVVMAESLDEARAALTSDRAYDVVLSDLSLPDGSGADLVAWLREAQPALAQRTIVLTGGAVDEAGRRLVADGLTEVLEKPTEPKLLLERVAAAAARGATTAAASPTPAPTTAGPPRDAPAPSLAARPSVGGPSGHR